MAIAFRGVASASITSSQSTITIAKPAGVVAGDVMIAILVGGTNNGITEPADWLQFRNDPVVGPGSAAMRLAAWVHVAGPDEGDDYTWSPDVPSNTAGIIVAYSGVDPDNPIDVHGFVGDNSGNDTQVTAPSVTATVAGRLICAFATDDVGAMTAPAGMTERADLATGGDDCQLMVADEQLAAAGATGPRTATGASTNNDAGISIVLKPAAGAPTGVSATGALPVEWRVGLARAGAVAAGWRAAVRAAAVFAAEWRARVGAIAPIPADALAAAANARPLPTAWRASLRAADPIAVAWTMPAARAGTIPAAWRASLARARPLAAGWLSGLDAAAALPVAWAQTVARAAPIPVAWSGAVLVPVGATAPIPVAWRATVGRAVALPVAWRAGLRPFNPLAIEWRGALVRARPVPVEWLRDIARTTGLPVAWDALVPVSATAVIPVAWDALARVSRAVPIPVEWQDSIAFAPDNPDAFAGATVPTVFVAAPEGVVFAVEAVPVTFTAPADDDTSTTL